MKLLFIIKKKWNGKKMVPYFNSKKLKKMKNHESRRFMFKMVVGIQTNNFSNPQVVETHKHIDPKI